MKVFIFDMDGTFLDSMDQWNNLFVDFMESKNIKVNQDMIDKVNAMTASEALSFIIDEFQLDSKEEDLIQEMNDYMANYYKNIVNIDPDIKDYFSFLKDNGKKIVLATATISSLVDDVLKRFNLEETFDLVVASDKVDLHKDSPQYFLNIAKNFNVEAKDCIVFEDSLYSILSAKEAGMEVISITFQSSKNDMDEIRENSMISANNFGQIKEELKKVL